ncbi:MAG: DUF1320 domain-containing protein [Proteobacteria bacterium]|nr:DUF1320 domain-containing protein [Pseudomonadota bacterium]
MAYATQADLLKALPELELIRLTDDDGAGSIDTDKVAEALDSAADEINVWIGGRVKLPLTATVPVLLNLNRDLAVYNLYSRVSTEVPETWRERRKDALKLLEKINDGKVSLGAQPPPAPPASTGYDGGIQTQVRTQIFSETELDKF